MMAEAICVSIQKHTITRKHNESHDSNTLNVANDFKQKRISGFCIILKYILDHFNQ